MILAPLRGVTIRCFRETFAREIGDAGFTEAITPFITATPGFDPMRDRELKPSPFTLHPSPLKTTPQFIGKDPEALRACLERVKEAGYDTADLNAGCPFPMVRNKGRGSGLLKTPDVLRRMVEVGCEVMGEGRFSVKTRLGVDRPDELLALMPLINCFPLRFLTVHARTARQMYEGACDRAAFERVAAMAQVPIVYNGDVGLTLDSGEDSKRTTTSLGAGEDSKRTTASLGAGEDSKRTTARSGARQNLLSYACCFSTPTLMIGRAFVRHLGEGDDAPARLLCYLDASVRELNGDHAVLGRMKELIAYWKDLPHWRRLWPVIKLVRTVAELRSALS